MNKQFNFRLFNRLAVFFAILIVISFYFAYALDEGNSLSTILKGIASLFYVLRYPSFLLLYIFDGLPSYGILLALFVNSVFYAYLTERITSLLLRSGKN